MKYLQVFMVALLGVATTTDVQAGLPIGGDEARARGLELPLPFGISWYHMDQEQPFKVNDLQVTAFGSPVPGVMIKDLENSDVSDNLRLDAWLFPFLDVYALLGKTDSKTTGTAVVPAGAFGPGSPAQMIPFAQKYHGDTLGLGITLVYGYQNLFASLDMNHTETDIDISSDDAKATVFNPRVGWNGQRGGFKGSLWLGAMYQDLKQTLEVNTTFNGIPVTAVVEQEAAEPLNYVVGGRWNIDPRFQITLEWGFGEQRDHWLANAGYRF